MIGWKKQSAKLPRVDWLLEWDQQRPVEVYLTELISDLEFTNWKYRFRGLRVATMALHYNLLLQISVKLGRSLSSLLWMRNNFFYLRRPILLCFKGPKVMWFLLIWRPTHYNAIPILRLVQTYCIKCISLGRFYACKKCRQLEILYLTVFYTANYAGLNEPLTVPNGCLKSFFRSAKLNPEIYLDDRFDRDGVFFETEDENGGIKTIFPNGTIVLP